MNIDASLISSSFNYNNDESTIPLKDLGIGTDDSRDFFLSVKQYRDTNTYNGKYGEWITEIGCYSSESCFASVSFVSQFCIGYSKRESLVSMLVGMYRIYEITQILSHTLSSSLRTWTRYHHFEQKEQAELL